MANISDVADWFLSQESMTPKKLQKLCYYFVAWGHALFSEDMAPDAKFEAWVDGPVSPTLFAKFRDYGWNEISKIVESPNVFDEKETQLLASVFLTYGPLSANELGALSHSELPWQKARGNCPADVICKNPILPEDMRSYYKLLYEQSQGE